MLVNILSNIDKNFSFKRENKYVISGEVHVLSNITVTIQNKTTIYIVNGDINSPLGNCAFIFDTGSKLISKNFTIRACDKSFIEQKKAENGGLWFKGSSSIAEKDTIKVTFSPNVSNFQANRITTHYLGRKDPVRKKNTRDDIDAISVIGVNNNEWNVKEIYSFNSGDDGFDVENSSICIDKLFVRKPCQDGLNVTSSRLNILKYIDIVVAKKCDNQLFDLETDDGPSFIRLAKECKVILDGVFGDQLTLVSDDLPQPVGKDVYKYDGYSKLGQSYIYSGFKVKCVKKKIKN